MSKGVPRSIFYLFIKEQGVVVCKQETAFIHANLGERVIHCARAALAIPGKEVVIAFVAGFILFSRLVPIWGSAKPPAPLSRDFLIQQRELAKW
jgi:hypothetical protein